MGMDAQTVDIRILLNGIALFNKDRITNELPTGFGTMLRYGLCHTAMESAYLRLIPISAIIHNHPLGIAV